MKLVQFGPGATLRSIVTARRSAECQVCLGLCDTCYIERTHRKREMVLFDDSTLPSIASLAWISTDLNSPKVEAFSLAALCGQGQRQIVPPRDDHGGVQEARGDDDGQMSAAVELDVDAC